MLCASDLESLIITGNFIIVQNDEGNQPAHPEAKKKSSSSGTPSKEQLQLSELK